MVLFRLISFCCFSLDSANVLHVAFGKGCPIVWSAAFVLHFVFEVLIIRFYCKWSIKRQIKNWSNVYWRNWRPHEKKISEQTSRGMNAYENDYKCGGRINTMLNTYGNFESLRRKCVLIYAARETISVQSYQWKYWQTFSVKPLNSNKTVKVVCAHSGEQSNFGSVVFCC